MIVSSSSFSTLDTPTFRLEVSIDEAHQVQILERCRHFACVKASIVFWYTFSRASLKRYTNQRHSHLRDNETDPGKIPLRCNIPYIDRDDPQIGTNDIM